MRSVERKERVTNRTRTLGCCGPGRVVDVACGPFPIKFRVNASVFRFSEPPVRPRGPSTQPGSDTPHHLHNHMKIIFDPGYVSSNPFQVWIVQAGPISLTDSILGTNACRSRLRSRDFAALAVMLTPGPLTR